MLKFNGLEYQKKGHKYLYDDSTTNAIEIIQCSLDDWNKKDRFLLNEGTGFDGIWYGDLLCDPGTYRYAVTAQYELDRGTDYLLDDSAFGNIEIRCNDLKNQNINYKTYDIEK